MLDVVEVKSIRYVRLSEFYDKVGLPRKTYFDFIRRYIVSNQTAEKEIDYLLIEPKKLPIGRPRQDYLISIGFLKTLCFIIKSAESRRIKTWANTVVTFTIIR